MKEEEKGTVRGGEREGNVGSRRKDGNEGVVLQVNWISLTDPFIRQTPEAMPVLVMHCQ